MKPFDLPRRKLLFGALALTVTGCATNPLVKSVADSFAANRRARKTKKTFSAASVEKIPYASMGVRLGGSDQALVVLAKNINDDLYWVSANQVTLVTRHGRLIRTIGLVSDLRTTRFGSPDPVQTGLQVIPQDENLIRFVDVRPGAVDVAATSVFRIQGEEQIEILGQPRPTLRVEEHVSVWRWNWHVKNHYWVDPMSGFVWKSRQHIVPKLAEMELEIFKPAKLSRA